MWGESLRELLHSCTKTLSGRRLFNGLWNGKTFPAVGALPSQQILFQEPSSPCSSAPLPIPAKTR